MRGDTVGDTSKENSFMAEWEAKRKRLVDIRMRVAAAGASPHVPDPTRAALRRSVQVDGETHALALADVAFLLGEYDELRKSYSNLSDRHDNCFSDDD